MSDPVNFDREGTFRGEVLEYALQDTKETKSVGVVLKLLVHDFYNRETEMWEDWRQFQMEGYGTVWIVKKDGAVNEPAAASLVEAAGWSGNLNDITTNEWRPEPLQFDVKHEVYKNQDQFKASFIKPYDATPGGGLRAMDGKKAQGLQSALGAQFRAIAGNVKAKMPTAGSKPPAPPSNRADQEAEALAATAPNGEVDEPKF
jgi:hypothetical protein